MRERPTYEPGTMGAALTERGFVACWCGVSMRRTSGPWACGRRGCSPTSAGGAMDARPGPNGEDAGSSPARQTTRAGGETAATPCSRQGAERRAGSSPAQRTTFKPRAGKAAEDALAAALVQAGFEVIDFRTWLWRALDGTLFPGFVREFVVGSLLADPRRFRADLFHPATRTCIEIEGGAHGVQRQRRGDIVREQLLTAAGLRVVRVLPEQCHPSRDGTPPAALALVQAALEGGQSA